MSVAIRVEHLSKEYRLGVINHGMLYKDIQSWLARKLGRMDPHAEIGVDHFADLVDRFWALKDLSFDIGQGDRVGIIGRNGAGKSTLLKILSRITAPTEGVAKIKGRVTSLLEVGTGFHGELTGRENIFLNGAILGMKKHEIAKKIDEIIDFSEIEQHIDTPVKRYSSGMYVRLAFAVAASLESDILLADEVLAVGDAAFQKKCLGKMDAVSKDEGRTILFVSHNMSSVRQLCTRGILLDHGRVSLSGSIDECVSGYLGKITKTMTSWNGEGVVQKSKYMSLKSIQLLDRENRQVEGDVDSREKIFVKIGFELMQKDPDFTIGFRLYNSAGDCVYRSLSSDRVDNPLVDFKLGLNNISGELAIESLKTDTYLLAIDASLHCRAWIIDPDRDQGYSISFNVINDSFGSRFQPSSPYSPLIKWERR